jgi:glycosyltransferase involved in cell wall biosynthesis
MGSWELFGETGQRVIRRLRSGPPAALGRLLHLVTDPGREVRPARPTRRNREGRLRPVYRLLLITSACDGEDVGEAWMGFQWVSRLAARHDVTLLTMHRRDRTPPSRQVRNARVVEWCDAKLLARQERLNSLLKPGWIPFYCGARRWIRNALARGEHFDVAHQLLPIAMRYPSPVAGLGIPYLIGPVGGSLENPPGFADDTSAWYVRLRALDRLRLRRDPLLRHTYLEADCVLGIAPYVRDILAGLDLRRFEVMSDTGLTELPALADRPASDGTVHLLYVGRLVRTKGLRDAIRALARLTTPTPVLLEVVGEGPDRPACEALVKELGLGSAVRFHGRQPRERVEGFYRDADIFVFPSYREAGGNVVFESMGYGVPLVVSDLGGPSSSVDDTCAIRVHPKNPDQYADDLAAAIIRLVDDPGLRAQMGAAARKRVGETALWDRKVEQLEALYDDLLPRSGEGVLQRS